MAFTPIALSVRRVRSLIAPLVLASHAATLLVDVRSVRFDGTARRALVFQLFFVDIGPMLLNDVIGRFLHPHVDIWCRVLSRLVRWIGHEEWVPGALPPMRAEFAGRDREFVADSWVPTSKRPEEAVMTDWPSADDVRDDVPLDPDAERGDPNLEPQPGDDTEVESPSTVDPDLEAARAQAPTQDPMVLTTEELRAEEEQTEYEPPYEPTPDTAAAMTVADERVGETLEDRLEQEEPEATP